MPVVVVQDVVVIGVHRIVLVGYFLNFGVQVETDLVLVHVIDAITIKVQAVDIMHQK